MYPKKIMRNFQILPPSHHLPSISIFDALKVPTLVQLPWQALTSVLAFDRFDASLREALQPLLERRGVSSLAVLGAVSDRW